MQPILSCHIRSRLVFYSCVCISMYNWSNGDFSNSETIVACFYFLLLLFVSLKQYIAFAIAIE